jgi:peroxiredoxin Q/BCP
VVAAGESFPLFDLISEAGETVRVSELRGAWFLLYWYPKADTPGCTAQALGLNDQIEVFGELGCSVYGASFDDAPTNAAFRHKHRLQFPLLSDVDGSVAVLLGVVESADADQPPRVAHLVDPDGVVAVRYEVDDPEFFAEHVLDDLERLLGG